MQEVATGPCPLSVVCQMWIRYIRWTYSSTDPEIIDIFFVKTITHIIDIRRTSQAVSFLIRMLAKAPPLVAICSKVVLQLAHYKCCN
jgi:hypothetical protein